MSKRVFIGWGSQPKNTIGRFAATARSTCASMPCSLDSTSLKLPSPYWFSLISVSTRRLPSLPGSMP